MSNRKQWQITNGDSIPSVNLFRRIILFDTAKQAKWYLDNCYDHWPKVVVMSADGVYPKNYTLQKTAKHNWLSNSGLTIFVMGWHSLEKMPKPATKIVFSLDRLIVESCRDRDDSMYSELILDWNPIKLARIIRGICETTSTRNAGFAYRDVKTDMHDFSKVPAWLIDLIK